MVKGNKIKLLVKQYVVKSYNIQFKVINISIAITTYSSNYYYCLRLKENDNHKSYKLFRDMRYCQHEKWT